LTLRRYRLLTTDAPSITTRKSHPLVHAHVPAGRNRPRTRISREAVVLMIRRRLKDCCYGLPTGRVTGLGRRFLINHVEDAPRQDWQDRVIPAFRLERRQVKCRVPRARAHVGGRPHEGLEDAGHILVLRGLSHPSDTAHAGGGI
jgi:hypothetical protein